MRSRKDIEKDAKHFRNDLSDADGISTAYLLSVCVETLLDIRELLEKK